jgi:DNA-binding response OmpR family regulator
MEMKEMRVLIADGDNNFSGRISRYLMESGFKTKVINNSYLLQKTLLEWRPHFLFIDLMFPGCYAQKCLNFLAERKLLGEGGIHVIVMSHHNAELNVRNCLESGAEDFMVKPFQMIDLLQRLALLSQAKSYNFKHLAQQSDHQIRNYFQMISLLVEAANQNKEVSEMRFDMTKMVALALKAVRVSLIVTDEDRNNIQVIRSSDDPNLNALNLDLKKYPEIQYVLRTEKALFIESIEKDQTLSFVKHEVKTIQFDSMMILPIKPGGILEGCLSIRMPKECKKLSFFDIKVAEVAAQTLAITWKFNNPSSQSSAA